MRHYFLNLTNGIEYLPETDFGQVHFVRLRSTTVERKDWLYMLMDLDHNFLLHLALGKECIFVDYGTNRKNSKTVYHAIPMIEYILTRRWFGTKIEEYRLGRNTDKKCYDVKDQYKHAYNELFVFDSTPEKNRLKTKLDYYKRFLDGKINLTAISESTHNDGNYPYYVNILKTQYK